MDDAQRQELESRIARAREEHPGERIDCYLLFADHFDAMSLLDVARRNSIEARVSTTPRLARSCCGVSLLISCDDAVAMNDLALECDITLEGTAALPCQINPKRDRYC